MTLLSLFFILLPYVLGSICEILPAGAGKLEAMGKSRGFLDFFGFGVLLAEVKSW